LLLLRLVWRRLLLLLLLLLLMLLLLLLMLLLLLLLLELSHRQPTELLQLSRPRELSLLN